MSDSEEDWEKEDIPNVVVPKNKWDDEDVDDNIKESWDDEDDIKPPPLKPTTKTATKPKTKELSNLKQKIAERDALEAAQKSLKKDLRGVNGGDFDTYIDETPEEKKKRLQQQVLESDLENARELFGVTQIKSDDTLTLDTLIPKNKEEFDTYLATLIERTKKFENHGLYPNFVESLARNLVSSLSVENIRKVASTLTAVSNEKQKALKEAAAKGKKSTKKAVLRGSVRNDDTTAYNEDDFDDFD
ncbi:hypothetical protein HK096_004065, partial [Nowakowskiella sp. JEL0078]